MATTMMPTMMKIMSGLGKLVLFSGGVEEGAIACWMHDLERESFGGRGRGQFTRTPFRKGREGWATAKLTPNGSDALSAFVENESARPSLQVDVRDA